VRIIAHWNFTVHYKNGFVALLNIWLPSFTKRSIKNAPDHTENDILRYDSDLHCDMDQYNRRVRLHAKVNKVVNRYICIMFHNSLVYFVFLIKKNYVRLLEIPVLIYIYYPPWKPIIKQTARLTMADTL
jgi:hypothetical protein